LFPNIWTLPPLKYVTGGNIGSTGRRGRRHKQLLDDLKDTWICWEFKDEALDRTVWGTRFERSLRPIVREADWWSYNVREKWMDEYVGNNSDNGKSEVRREKSVQALMGPSKNSICSDLEMKPELSVKGPVTSSWSHETVSTYLKSLFPLHRKRYVHYRDQGINAVLGDSHCVFWDQAMTTCFHILPVHHSEKNSLLDST
jgi:hypothetical protein